MLQLRIGRMNIRLNNFFIILLLLAWIVNIFWEYIIIFTLVFFHELAHSYVANKYGMTTKEIELLPFGGVAKIEGLFGAGPQAEIAVAFAGPLLNFVLALSLKVLSEAIGLNNHYINFVINSNIIIGVFNLIPALPLDGGRILRGIMSTIIGFKRATKITAFLGKLFALSLFIISFFLLRYGTLYGNIFIVSLFLYIAAKNEEENNFAMFITQWGKKKEELAKRGAMEVRKLVTLPDTEIGKIAEIFLPQKFNTVRVLDKNHKTVNDLTETEIYEGMLKFGPKGKIKDIKG